MTAAVQESCAREKPVQESDPLEVHGQFVGHETLPGANGGQSLLVQLPQLGDARIARWVQFDGGGRGQFAPGEHGPTDAGPQRHHERVLEPAGGPDAGLGEERGVGVVVHDDGQAELALQLLPDRHVAAGRGEQAALIYDSAVTRTRRTYTYRQLRNEVALFAGALAADGVIKGDRVLIYMPMIPEAAIAMLASARIGAVHSVVFGGFAANELATRIDDAKPKVVVSRSAIMPQRRPSQRRNRPPRCRLPPCGLVRACSTRFR